MFHNSDVAITPPVSGSVNGSATITPHADCVSFFGTKTVNFIIDERAYLPDQIINTDLGLIDAMNYGHTYPNIDDVKDAILAKNPSTAANVD
jgi:hypothetical protein